MKKVAGLLMIWIYMALGFAVPYDSQPDLYVFPGIRASISVDADQLFSLYARAQKGDAQAQYMLGVAYGMGAIGPKNPEQAAFWLQKSSQFAHKKDAYLIWKGPDWDLTFD